MTPQSGAQNSTFPAALGEPHYSNSMRRREARNDRTNNIASARSTTSAQAGRGGTWHWANNSTLVSMIYWGSATTSLAHSELYGDFEPLGSKETRGCFIATLSPE